MTEAKIRRVLRLAFNSFGLLIDSYEVL